MSHPPRSIMSHDTVQLCHLPIIQRVKEFNSIVGTLKRLSVTARAQRKFRSNHTRQKRYKRTLNWRRSGCHKHTDTQTHPHFPCSCSWAPMSSTALARVAASLSRGLAAKDPPESGGCAVTTACTEKTAFSLALEGNAGAEGS